MNLKTVAKLLQIDLKICFQLNPKIETWVKVSLKLKVERREQMAAVITLSKSVI